MMPSKNFILAVLYLLILLPCALTDGGNNTTIHLIENIPHKTDDAHAKTQNVIIVHSGNEIRVIPAANDAECK
jgi:hypothetical protein